MENQELLDKLIYKETSEGMILRGIKDKYRDDIVELIIPESWNVINIQKERRDYSPDCFSHMKNLKKLVLPSSLKRLDFHAFRGCIELDDISLPEGIERMGFSPFENTKYWNDNSHWDKGTLYIGNYLIKCFTSGPTLIIKEGTTLIASCACTELDINNLELPESLLYICSQAFYGCKKLNKVMIPPSIKYIDEQAFMYADNVELINAGKDIYKVEMNENHPTLAKEKGYISIEKLEEILKELEGYNLKIELETSYTYENAEGDDVTNNNSYSSIYHLDFRKHASSLAFLDNELFGIVFTKKQDYDPHYVRYLFPFHMNSEKHMLLGYSASHSSSYLTIKNVSLIKKDDKEHNVLSTLEIYETSTSL